MSLPLLNPGDLIVIADLEKSNVWEILQLLNDGNYRLKWKPTGFHKNANETHQGTHPGTDVDLRAIAPMVKKITNKRWLDFLYDRDPWDFFTKMEYYHNKYPIADILEPGSGSPVNSGSPRNFSFIPGSDSPINFNFIPGSGSPNELDLQKRRAVMQEILDNRDLEILNWYIFNRIVPMQDQINDLVKRGDLQSLKALYTRDYKPDDFMLDWAVESQYTTIIKFLILIGLTPSQGAVNWCCKYGAPQNLELLLIGGFFPDSVGVQYILDSGDLYKLTLMDIFNLRLN